MSGEKLETEVRSNLGAASPGPDFGSYAGGWHRICSEVDVRSDLEPTLPISGVTLGSGGK